MSTPLRSIRSHHVWLGFGQYLGMPCQHYAYHYIVGTLRAREIRFLTHATYGPLSRSCPCGEFPYLDPYMKSQRGIPWADIVVDLYTVWSAATLMAHSFFIHRQNLRDWSDCGRELVILRKHSDSTCTDNDNQWL
jgi:hypothetical protein